MQTIYIEKDILDHPRTKKILEKISAYQMIECENYKEVFNPKTQNFRIQKQKPALILAQKPSSRINVSPQGFGIGGAKNYYFSHMLNCLYDCRYCFLQGMYSSAHYVVFVNYEDFMLDIENLCKQTSERLYFFSGYDCDSLAYEPVTQFVKEFLPFFRGLKNGILELRTKSTNIKELLQQPPIDNCIIAFSFTPQEISEAVEHKVPAVNKRIQAIKALTDYGWSVGLRFDPIIYHSEFKTIYTNLINQIFNAVPADKLHSVSLGPMRFPEKMYQHIVKLYPHDPLLAHPLYRHNKVYSYKKELEVKMKEWINHLLEQHVNKTILFECHI